MLYTCTKENLGYVAKMQIALAVLNLGRKLTGGNDLEVVIYTVVS